jgi:hypothetical protein
VQIKGAVMLRLKRAAGESLTLRVPPNSGAQLVGVKVLEVQTRIEPRVTLSVDSVIRVYGNYREGQMLRIVIPSRDRVQEVRISVLEGQLSGYSAMLGIAANSCVHILRDELELENDGQ